MIPELDLTRIGRWVEARNSDLPERAQGLIRYEIDFTGRTVTILECRPPWRPDFGQEWTRFPVARLRYTKTKGEWSLYWCDRNLKFHEYDLVPPTPLVHDLIAEIERDPTLWVRLRDDVFTARQASDSLMVHPVLLPGNVFPVS